MWQDVAVARTNLIFVASAGLDTGDKNFPHAALAAQAHRMASRIPGVEVADDADALCIGGPDGEGGPLDAIDLAQVGTESFEGAQMRAFREQPDIEFAEDCRKAVRVVNFLYAARPDDAQAVVELWIASENGGFEKTGRFTQCFDLALCKFDQDFTRVSVNGEDRPGTRLHGAQPETALGVGMQAESGERVTVFGVTECENFSLVQHGGPFRLFLAASPCPRCRRHIRGWCGQTRKSPCQPH